jgi:hypothetical protein
MSRGKRGVVVVVAVACAIACDRAAPRAAEFEPEVKEISIFKDGHALVVREGRGVPADGTLVTTTVPESLLGTFWVAVEEGGPALEGVSAEWRTVEEDVPCTSVAEIVRANAGRAASLVVMDGDTATTVTGTLLPLAKRAETRERTPPAVPPPRYGWRSAPAPERSRAVEEVETVPEFAAVRDEATGAVTFVKLADVRRVEVDGAPALTRTISRKERALTLRFDRPSRRPVKVTLVSVERGVRWIPEYRIEHSKDARTARVRFQASVVNDILDLKGVRAHFVVGVPRFELGRALAPTALAEVPRSLSSYFAPPSPQGGAGVGFDSNRYSNAMMSQVLMPAAGAGPARVDAVPAGVAGDRAADLYVYHRERFTLSKGARASVTLWEHELPAREVYTWDIEPEVPKELWRHVDQSRRRQLAARLAEPKVMRALRLTNTLDAPLTTGAAALFREGRILAQDILTYTSTGNAVDVPVTVAIDVNSSVRDEETGREHNAVKIGGSNYTRVRMRSELRLVSFRDDAVRVKVSRSVFGSVTEAGGGDATVRSQSEAFGRLARTRWWGWWGGYWPNWWWSANSFSSVEWTVEVPAGKTKTIFMEWEYYHRP